MSAVSYHHMHSHITSKAIKMTNKWNDNLYMVDLKNNKRKAEEYNMIFPLLSIHCQDKTALGVE